jgi:hypothetical protein
VCFAVAFATEAEDTEKGFPEEAQAIDQSVGDAVSLTLMGARL